ncbi:hypothetical protein E1B28_001541 [Marasmius oreades]|uniref:Uncharacterized protein n=1 Tax=Marasmius oreades TaxID=181124 RepID=A0A9P7V3T3_9AGAR|nr:uncharacterized protein E1B28_001541 [Marasmius oreades]KAG7099724.1 hypothetical protein E1B28_001541 [Marasmius oreades]
MWFSIYLALFLRSVAISHPLQSYPFPQPALPGVFGDEFDGPITSRPLEHSGKKSFSSPLFETVLDSATSELGHKIVPMSTPATPSLPFITHSVIGTPPSLPDSRTSQLLSPENAPHTITFATTASSTPNSTNNALSSAPKGNGKEWRIVKMLLITIGTVVAVILLVMFLKTAWIFLRDAFAGRKRGPEGREEMIPDWHRGSWEVKLATERGHRYPAADITMAPTSQVYAEAIHNEGFDTPSLPPRLALLSPSNPPVLDHSSPLCRRTSVRPQAWQDTRTYI